MTTPGLFPGNINADVDSVPSLAAKELADDERQYLGVLHGRLREARGRYVQDARYYEGEQRVQDLGISIPPNLVNLRIPVGWGRVGVDALEERLHVDGFRFGDETDVDEDLAQILDANDFYDEHGFAHLDALIFGKAYAFTGPGDDPEIPLITCESPLNASAMWDPRTRKVTAALLDWSDTRVTSDTYGQRIVTLMLPARAGESRGRIVTMTQDAGKWDVQHRDDQALPYVTVARLANRQRSSNRDGLSEITREQRAIIDAATRTLLGAEVARELFAMPRRWAVGVAEDQFVKPDGTPVSKFEAAMSAVWALPVPEDGIEPKVGQFAASEPTPFSHLLDMYAQQFASLAALPPHYVGLLSDGNPASAEAIIANDSRLVRRVERKQTTFGAGWKQMARHVLAYRNGGTIPDNAKRLELEWADAATPNLAGMTDALQKQIASGMVPAASDVVLRKAGYSAIDRLRLEVDRKADQGSQVLAELANSMQAKQIRAVTTVDKNLNPNAPTPGASSSSTPTPTPSANAGSSSAGK